MIDMGKERPWICSYQNWVNYAMSYHVLFLYQNKTTSVETVLQSVSAFLERLLEDQAPLESYVEWLDSMVDRCVIKVFIFIFNISSDFDI
jgi:hypothetical protein